MSITTHTPTMGLGRPPQANDVGSSPSSSITAEEFGAVGSPVRTTKLTFTNVTFTLTRTSGTIASGGVQCYDFPKGGVSFLGAAAKLTYSIAGSGTYANLVSSVGTVAALTDNATLTTTEANVIASTASASSSGAASFTGAMTATAAVNGTGTAADLYLNAATSDDISSSRVVTVNGWLIVHWIAGGNTDVA
jgi:hypothetical protein